MSSIAQTPLMTSLSAPRKREMLGLNSKRFSVFLAVGREVRPVGVRQVVVERVELDDAVAPHALRRAREAKVEERVQREHALVADPDLLDLDVRKGRLSWEQGSVPP